VATTSSTSFTTTMGVIDRVHRNATNMWAATEVTRTSSLTQVQVAVIRIAHAAYRSTALDMDFTDFTGRQLKQSVAALLRLKLCTRSSGADHLATLSWLQLDVVQDGTQWDVLQLQCIARLNIRVSRTYNLVSDIQLVGAKDIGLRTVSVVQESNVRRAVWIILDRCYSCGHARLDAFEVNNTIPTLSSTTTVTCSNATGVVATTCL
jgi:hypothetical protein